MSTSRALACIDQIAQWGVFQLAIGGGEPLLREDLERLARHAAGRGLTVHVTTNGDHLVRDRLMALSGSLTCLQVGIRHRHLLNLQPGSQARRLRQICRVAQELGVTVGANLILCRSVLERFEEAICRLVGAGFRRVTLLRYKPPASLEQWRKEAPSGSEMVGVEEEISGIVSRYPGITIRLDCALAFLQRELPAEQARRSGLRGCVAGARIVAISPKGAIYPCSQLVAPRFRVGHVLEDDLRDVWNSSRVLSSLRRFRSHPDFRRSACGACRAMAHCGGCRVFTHEGNGPDPGCPSAITGPLADVMATDGLAAPTRRLTKTWTM
jgi:radical SAM protein with 4Fe4S-binding SPASM domain